MARISRGFTLLELLVVIVIIGLLAGLVGPRYFETVGKSKVKVARAQMVSLQNALDQYRLELGRLPTREVGLDALVNAPASEPKWAGPYIKKGVPLDPWGNAYVYSITTKGDIELTSLGADGKPGGEGDAKDLNLSDPD